jgi:hypothetical protein
MLSVRVADPDLGVKLHYYFEDLKEGLLKAFNTFYFNIFILFLRRT